VPNVRLHCGDSAVASSRRRWSSSCVPRLETAILLLHLCEPALPLSFLPFPLGPRQIQMVALPFLRFPQSSAQGIDFRFLVIGVPLQFLQRDGGASVTSGEGGYRGVLGVAL
jgi:hypothetical protein